MIDIKQNMLWPTMLFEMQMPDYNTIKEDLVEYILTCEVEEVKTSGIGPFEQMHKKNLNESYQTLFNNNDSEVFNKVKDFCMNLTLDIAKNVNSNHTDTFFAISSVRFMQKSFTLLNTSLSLLLNNV
jgi:hypothetical protein